MRLRILESWDCLKLAVNSDESCSKVLQELLSPWTFVFTDIEKAELVLTYDKDLINDKKSIVIPSDSPSFAKTTKSLNLQVSKHKEATISASMDEDTCLFVTPKVTYTYGGFNGACQDGSIGLVDYRHDLALLKLDVIDEFKTILKSALNPKPSKFTQVMSKLPGLYQVLPKQIKNASMRQKRSIAKNTSYCHRLPLDALRLALVEAIEALSQKKPIRKTWKSKKYTYVLTHDVDTLQGLKNARHLLNLEEKYGATSAWYIPSRRYRLNAKLVKEIANSNEIGAHDTKHDGQLAFLSKSELIKRLIQAREDLANIIGRPIHGFRSPLLQCKTTIIEALERAGYSYDTSVPTWEPRHPFTMNPHGVGTVFPLLIGKIVEIPVTVPQDHQLLTVLGLTPRNAVEEMLKIKETVSKLGGVCTFLVHPDYALASPTSNCYEELLNALVTDDQASRTVPSDLASSIVAERAPHFQKHE